MRQTDPYIECFQAEGNTAVSLNVSVNTSGCESGSSSMSPFSPNENFSLLQSHVPDLTTSGKPFSVLDPNGVGLRQVAGNDTSVGLYAHLKTVNITQTDTDEGLVFVKEVSNEPTRCTYDFSEIRNRNGVPDLEEMRAQVQKGKVQVLEEREWQKKSKKNISGVGSLLGKLRSNDSPKIPERIVLNDDGRVIQGSRTVVRRNCTATFFDHELTPREQELLDIDLPPGPPHPTDPAEIRRLVRSKMVRCHVCKNRFGERNLLERHLRDKHEVEYVEYCLQQEEEIARQREEELENNRIEELVSGGFIPPANYNASENFDVELDAIPLPGEFTNGFVPRFDAEGRLILPKRVYKRKISPQCPFCDKRFRNDVSLRKHLEKKHEGCEEFVQCLECFKCLPTAEDLHNHLCDLSFMCFECTPMRNMHEALRLRLHRAKFHRGAASGFKCNLCALKFLTPRKLRKHKKMAHIFARVFQCHFCEEVFDNEVAVSTHERIHTGMIRFECEICDFRANRYPNMLEHKKEEHGYNCSLCQDKFAEWEEHKEHMLAVHGGYLTDDAARRGFIECPRVWVMFKGE